MKSNKSDHTISLENNIAITRMYDGTMVNVFYHNNEWTLSTRSYIGAKNYWNKNSKKSFKDMFNECFDKYNELNTNNSYSFVLQHKDNSNITPVEENKVILVEEYNLDNGVPNKVNLNDNKYTFRQHLKFKVKIPQLSSTSSVFVKVDTDLAVLAYNPGGQGSTYSINPSSTGVTKESTSGGITLEVEETTSLSTNEARFTETSTSSTSTENFNLDDVLIGVTESDATYSITDINNEAVTENLYRGSNQVEGEVATQLLVKEFLEMQQSPLQILQGSIQSANISPLDIVKYKLNSNAAAAKYYMFFGGTFKANSEIMEGEWFRIKGD